MNENIMNMAENQPKSSTRAIERKEFITKSFLRWESQNPFYGEKPDILAEH